MSVIDRGVERVTTLDELMDQVPEELVRQVEIPKATEFRSKAARVLDYLENNPDARNKDVFEALRSYGVTIADVANAKQRLKKVEELSSPKPQRPDRSISLGGPTINWNELEKGMAFVKAAGSVQRAQHLLIIIDQIKGA